MSVSQDLLNRNLTYKAWIPFNYSSPAVYLAVYIHQLIAMSTSGIVNVACESLFCGFLMHICCQFEILEYRLTKLIHDQNMGDCVYHHNRIFELVYLNSFVLKTNFSSSFFLFPRIRIDCAQSIHTYIYICFRNNSYLFPKLKNDRNNKQLLVRIYTKNF